MDNIIVADNLAISESGFLFLPSSGETFTSNEIGKNIIRMLQKGLSKEDMANEIIKEYEIEKNTVEKDLDDFMNQLFHFKLIEEK